jgi:hypothetical protein
VAVYRHSICNLLGATFTKSTTIWSIIMLNKENQIDKERFDKLKEAQVGRGRDEGTATEVAAEEVKEMRSREGRSKKDDLAHPRK